MISVFEELFNDSVFGNKYYAVLYEGVTRFLSLLNFLEASCDASSFSEKWLTCLKSANQVRSFVSLFLEDVDVYSRKRTCLWKN
jgi:hypothetical protein